MNIVYFKLIIKDYEDSKPLKDKEIQIVNVDTKKCYESKFASTSGELIFNIAHNKRGDFLVLGL